MRFSIEIIEKDDGGFEAKCSELGISTRGVDLEEVFDKMKHLVSFFVSNTLGFGDEIAEPGHGLEEISESLKGKTLHIPLNNRIH